MSVHVSGGVPSEVCSNYTLKRTAGEQIEKKRRKNFKKSFQPLTSKFYVDDLLNISIQLKMKVG